MHVLKVENPKKIYGNNNNLIKGVDDISFVTKPREFIAMVDAR